MAKQNELIKHLGLEIPKEIIDDITGEKLPVDHDKIKLALRIIADVQYDIARLAKNVKTFFVDERLYLYLGLTKNEAASEFFYMSENTIRRFERIAIAFEEQDINNLSYLGVGKLDALSQLNKKQKDELIESKVLKLADGSEMSLDEIRDIRVAELEKRLKRLRLENSKLSTSLEEETDLREAELKSLKREIKDLEALTNIDEKERPFHKRITKMQEARSVVYESTSAFHAAFMILHRIEITDSNRNITADIEGLLITVANRLLQIEEHFGLSLGHLKAEMQDVAAAK